MCPGPNYLHNPSQGRCDQQAPQVLLCILELVARTSPAHNHAPATCPHIPSALYVGCRRRHTPPVPPSLSSLKVGARVRGPLGRHGHPSD